MRRHITGQVVADYFARIEPARANGSHLVLLLDRLLYVYNIGIGVEGI